MPSLAGTSKKAPLNSSAACLVPRVHLVLQEPQDPQEWWEEWAFLVKTARTVRMGTEGTAERKVHLAGQGTEESKDRRAELGPSDGLALEAPRVSVASLGGMAHLARKDPRARRGSLASRGPAGVVVAVPSQPSPWP